MIDTSSARSCRTRHRLDVGGCRRSFDCSRSNEIPTTPEANMGSVTQPVSARKAETPRPRLLHVGRRRRSPQGQAPRTGTRKLEYFGRRWARSPRSPNVGAGAPPPADGEDEAIERRLLFRLHALCERDPEIIRRKKEAELERLGRLACEVCAFDFAATYGQLGEGFIDCHHRLPLSSSGERKTRLSNLALVCPIAIACFIALGPHSQSRSSE